MRIESLFPKPIGFSKLETGISEDLLNFCKIGKEKSYYSGGNMSSEEKYVLNQPEFSELKSFCDEKANEYFQKVFAPSSNCKLKITQSWLNYTKQGQFHHNHSHHNSFISGVFYIDTTVEDKIKFYEDIWDPYSIHTNQYNIYNSTSWWFPAEKNSLILFPSKLVHGVDGITEKHTRISLAFNTFFEGTLGDYSHSTELLL